MRYIASKWIIRSVLVIVVLGALALTGCSFLDQIFGGGTPPGGGTADAPQAVMTVQIADAMVARGDNPDHRPPISYKFSAVNSRDKFGDPIRKGIQEVAWDFGDGSTRGFEWSIQNYVTNHIYREEGTYTATLTVREPATYGGTTGTAQKTITIGPGWLKIISMATKARTDGQFDVTIVVKNQSHQVLGRIAVYLIDENTSTHGWTGRGADVTLQTPLAPNGGYTLKTVIGTWTGTLRAISWWCYPVPSGK